MNEQQHIQHTTLQIQTDLDTLCKWQMKFTLHTASRNVNYSNSMNGQLLNAVHEYKDLAKIMRFFDYFKTAAICHLGFQILKILIAGQVQRSRCLPCQILLKLANELWDKNIFSFFKMLDLPNDYGDNVVFQLFQNGDCPPYWIVKLRKC